MGGELGAGLQDETRVDVGKGTHRSSQAGLEGDRKQCLPVIPREKCTSS